MSKDSTGPAAAPERDAWAEFMGLEDRINTMDDIMETLWVLAELTICKTGFRLCEDQHNAFVFLIGRGQGEALRLMQDWSAAHDRLTGRAAS